MTIRLHEVMRSEIEGGLSAPAHVISNSSLDCGCKQFPCPKLAKYATRKVFLTILCLIGTCQAAAHTYLYITSSTISRRFQFDLYAMDWLLAVSEITPFIVGLGIAYWGDRIHRASWTGALVLLQSASYFALMIPHFSHKVRVIEETVNVTHMSIYADDSPELCTRGSARIFMEDDKPCYVTLVILTVAQIITGMANVAYYALGISYLDDNTKKKHVAVFIGLVLAIKIFGIVFGYILAWGFLKIDAENFNPVQSYREQIGAWWLGWPILAILLAIPATLLALFPRRLLSEMVEQAAATILDESGTMQRSQNTAIKKIGSTSFLPSLIRLIKNKILIFNILAAVFCTTAIFNFIANENIFLESQFYAPRPTGKLLGFSDPLISRTISNILKPVLIGLIIIVSGLIIAKAKPTARILAAYNLGIIVLTAIIIFSLAFDSCTKSPIVGERVNSMTLIKFCNRNCQCSRDANFQPVCDSNGMFTFYSACHAGCTIMDDTKSIRSYDKCSCVEEMTGKENFKAVEGPCGSNDCQIGWIIFEITTILAYSLLASSLVGDLLINLRSSYVQDKALTIGFWMMWTALFIHIPGKLIYQKLTDATCRHWGFEDRVCHLHDSKSLGHYLCFMTAGLLVIGAIFKTFVYIFCNNLEIYDSTSDEEEHSGRELQEITQIQAEPLLNPPNELSNDDANNTGLETSVEVEPVATVKSQNNQTTEDTNLKTIDQVTTTPLNYVPMDLHDHRTDPVIQTQCQNSIYDSVAKTDYADDELETSSDESNLFGKSSSPKIAYTPLELDSDVESDLYTTGPRSRKRVSSSNSASNEREFPNPDDYEDPRTARGTLIEPGTSKELLTTRNQSQGDFNEVGIPILESYEENLRSSRVSINKSNDAITLSLQYERTASQDRLEIVKSFMEPACKAEQIHAEIETKPEVSLIRPTRPPSRDQSSSGFGSLPDISESIIPQSLRVASSNSRESLNSITSESTSGSQIKYGPLTTDL